MKTLITAVLIFAVVAALVLLFSYNSLSLRDEKVITAWAPLESTLKERYDSIPRIIGAIELYVGHDIPEDDALAAAYPSFGQARTIAERAAAANKIEDMVQKLAQDVSERYSGISSSNEVDTAWQIYKETSERMLPAATVYNTAATTYNTFAREFPGNIVAPVLGFAGKYAYIQPQALK